MLESLLNKVAALLPETLLKKPLRQLFPVNFAKFSRTLSLHDCLISHYFKRDLTLHISFRRIPPVKIPKKIFEGIFVMPVAKE